MDPVSFIGAMLTGLGLLIGAGKAVVKDIIKDEPPKVEQKAAEPVQEQEPVKEKE